ncbi:hypothetical protein FE633_11945 [Streptomyces montanus]|uniref:Uncharacterized protein n=1 Tax=Streptomyces montanus TaxID=2580423 RepID=A0A5R9FV26_9ACTN|nr:hypothetical protein [Streptomyces montanus]TLS45866.1 hypothetical protein FE633_11945 [Streptomyces montanus]
MQLPGTQRREDERKMDKMKEIAGELRAAHAEGKDAVELALISREKLGPAFGVISFIASFRLAFNIPLPVLQRAQAWERFGWGGVQISDEEFSAILSPWLARQ